ncbi:MAG: hypothetical protein ACOYZ6_11735 [Chloroflexota bacterium]
MQIEDAREFRKSFLITWIIANAFGVSIGWAVGEWFGIQVASILGWKLGQIIGFAIYEGSIWVCRIMILKRIRTFDALKPFDTFFWLSTELIIGFGMQLGGGEPSYREASLLGIVSLPILSTWIGVIGWLIIWLIHTQMQKPRIQLSATRSLIASLGRAGGSLLIFFFLVVVMPVSTYAGEAVARISNWMLGRVVAGAVLGGLLSLLTGSAILRLMNAPKWDE